MQAPGLGFGSFRAVRRPGVGESLDPERSRLIVSRLTWLRGWPVA